MVAKVIKDHGVGGVNVVGSGQHLNSPPDVLWLLLIELKDSQTHQCTNTQTVQLKSTLKCQTGLVLISQLHEAVPHAKTYSCWTVGICTQSFFVKGQCTTVIL